MFAIVKVELGCSAVTNVVLPTTKELCRLRENEKGVVLYIQAPVCTKKLIEKLCIVHIFHPTFILYRSVFFSLDQNALLKGLSHLRCKRLLLKLPRLNRTQSQSYSFLFTLALEFEQRTLLYHYTVHNNSS